MTQLFLKLLNMSITASWLTIPIIFISLFWKKSPKKFNCILWAIVGIRFIMPFSPESIFSLIPSAKVIPDAFIYMQKPAIESGIGALDELINPVISESFAPDVTESATPLQIWGFIASWLWLLGVGVMLVYMLVNYLKVARRVREAIAEKDYFICDRIGTSFIFGLFRPRIYLPSNIKTEDEEYVLTHERAHISRLDYLWKPLGFLILCVHWFNPIAWLAYTLACRDIELATDEKAVCKLDTNAKKRYAEALLNVSAPKRLVSACPLAFGELGVKSRIKSILSYKKPARFVFVIALALSLVLVLCFLTNPIADEDGVFVPEGSFVYENADTFNSPELSLSSDNSFSLVFSPFTSYIAHGSYEIKEERLYLYDISGKYTYCFKTSGDKLIYLADKSSPISVMHLSKFRELEDGAVFKRAAK